jgi:prepilin-type N-terminal cleavage/methylation domain-containing protein
MKHYAKAQRGFTLIEMSIVLVIIGLIIGGILKGQELIESSRQKNVIAQIDRVKAGVTTFVDRFKSLPGDYGRADANLQDGLDDGDENGNVGPIRANTAGLLTANNLGTEENTAFFTHLLAADLIGGATIVPPATAFTCFSGNCATASPQPASAYPQTGLSILYGTHSGTTANPGSALQIHWLVLSRFAGQAVFPAGSGGAALSPERAFQLDSKYDDGLAFEGSIRAITTQAGCGSATTTYTATVTTVDCNLIFAAE